MPAKTSAGRSATAASGAKNALRSPSKARDGAPGGDTLAQERGLAAARDAAALDRRLASIASLEDRLREITRSTKGRVTFSTSLGLDDQAILHAIATSGVPIDVFTLDTGRHFPETLETLEASEQRYGVKIRVMTPDARGVEELVARDGIFGFRLAVENRKACCEVRKVRPLKRALAGASGWVTGLRRAQSAGRAAVPFAAWDADHSLVKVNPIADWTLEQLEVYIAEHKVPVNPLHAKGFPSIGCQPCTRAIKPGEDIRAGRWWWENEDGKECGLHNRPAQKEKAA
jgi:phosphoadenosine phosphosulfate reductase